MQCFLIEISHTRLYQKRMRVNHMHAVYSHVRYLFMGIRWITMTSFGERIPEDLARAQK